MLLKKSWLSVPLEILLLACSAAASTPLAAHVIRNFSPVHVPQLRDIEYAPVHGLIRRDGLMNLGTHSLATQFSNETLVSVDLNGLISIAGAPNLTVICVSCFTTGNVSLLSSTFEQDKALLENIPAATAELIKDPLGFIEEALNVTFEVDFQGLAGHFEVDVSFATAGAFSLPLLPADIQPLGVDIGGNLVGFVFSINLVISVTGELDVTTGFDIAWPNSTSITIDPIKGEILSMDLSGIQVSPLPIKFNDGSSACVQVALRFGLNAGLGINLLGIGANISAGAFVDAPAYKACAVFNSSAPCELALTQNVLGDAGAFAGIGGKIDFIQFSEGPKVVTTFFSADLPSLCIASTATVRTSSRTISRETITSTPAHSNSTSKWKPASATTTKAASLNGTFTTYTLTSCQSALFWCPSSLESTITITKPMATATATAAPQTVIITNAITITTFLTPMVSTVQSATANTTTVAIQTSGGDFAQRRNTTSFTGTVASASATSVGIGGVIVSMGGMAASTSAAGNVSSNGTTLQLTSDTPITRHPDYSFAALFVGLLSLSMLC